METQTPKNDNPLTKSQKTDKSTDALTKSLRGGFSWTRDHSVGLAIVLVILFGGGLVWSLLDSSAKKKEASLQESYYQIEKLILDQQQKFAEAKSKHESDLKSFNDAKKAKKPDPKAPHDPGPPPTENFERDYAPHIEKLKALVSSSPESKAAAMAALLASDLLTKQNLLDPSLEILNQVSLKDKSSLLYGLWLKQRGNALANLNKCPEAIEAWNQVIAQKSLAYLHSDTKLRQGLCYENLKDFPKAEALYQEVVREKSSEVEMGGGDLSKEAEKYLRLLRLKISGS